MEPEDSLPHSQVSATCPYPEPARSTPYPHIPLPEDPSLCYPLIYTWAYPVVSFPQVSPAGPYTSPLSLPIRATCPAHLILLDFITCLNILPRKGSLKRWNNIPYDMKSARVKRVSSFGIVTGQRSSNHVQLPVQQVPGALGMWSWPFIHLNLVGYLHYLT